MGIRVGFMGAHRTGKTTLAERVATESGLAFARTSTSEVFARHGLDPAEPIDGVTRLKLQQEILREGERVWGSYPGGFVTDRTPLDMAAYTLVGVQGDARVCASALRGYMRECFRAMGEHFDLSIQVQPGIELVSEAGKAACDAVYIEHLNVVMMGLAQDPEIGGVHGVVMARDLIELDARVQFATSVIRAQQLMAA